ncbi:MAG: epoxyqueuosine reductase QueH [Aquificae bacterium]|nr:epoxyqueuosine reductase QueH [Aquificota bacterium]
MKKSKILVHICCAPDAVHFLRKLRQEHPDKEIIGFFYDPNIHPYEEYRLRFLETLRVCEELNIKLIEGEYDPENWMRVVRGYENEPERGKRCEICFEHRLERSAKLAKELGCDYMTTTLLTSPKKSPEQLKRAGEKALEDSSVVFLAPDYRKGGGTQEMFRLSRERQLYQQDYCGCLYGLFKQREGEIYWELVGYAGRRPGSKQERAFIKEIRIRAQRAGLRTVEWEFPFLGWELLSGKVEVNGKTIPSLVLPYSQAIRGRVRGRVERVLGNKLFLNKQNVRIILKESLRDEPLKKMTPLTSPTFVVPSSWRGELLSGKITAELKAEFKPSKSSVLLIGSEEANEFLGFPADTLQDGRGVPLEEILTFLDENYERIIRGDTALLVLGAESLGRAGSAFVEETLGREVRLVSEWS